jgi:ribosomal-protein-alanine N-acetyltransferase
MKVEGFCVRAAGAADVVRVLALERGIVEAPHWAEAEYAAILNADGDIERPVRRCLFVAEMESRLMGFAVGKVIGSAAGGAADLESVAVDAAARRIGVGRAVCGAVVAWCRAQGARALELEVRAGSRGAIAMYAGLGFVVTGRRGAYYREPVEDAVLMRLDLASGG